VSFNSVKNSTSDTLIPMTVDNIADVRKIYKVTNQLEKYLLFIRVGIGYIDNQLQKLTANEELFVNYSLNDELIV